MPLKAWIILMWCAAASVVSAQEAAPQKTIVVIGEGRIMAVPDKADITLGARHFAKSAADAMAQTSQSTQAILDRLAKAGIESKDIQTSSLNLSPVWDDYKRSSSGKAPEPAGFEASNNISATLRDLSALGALLDTLTREGANSFSGFSFGLQNPEPVQDDARRAAVADARRKAELYAAAAGLTLGDVLLITEDQSRGGGGMPRPMMTSSAARSSSVPIAQGEITLSASIKIIYTLK